MYELYDFGLSVIPLQLTIRLLMKLLPVFASEQIVKTRRYETSGESRANLQLTCARSRSAEEISSEAPTGADSTAVNGTCRVTDQCDAAVYA